VHLTCPPCASTPERLRHALLRSRPPRPCRRRTGRPTGGHHLLRVYPSQMQQWYMTSVRYPCRMCLCFCAWYVILRAFGVPLIHVQYLVICSLARFLFRCSLIPSLLRIRITLGMYAHRVSPISYVAQAHSLVGFTSMFPYHLPFGALPQSLKTRGLRDTLSEQPGSPTLID
jgi:hypothetical protein